MDALKACLEALAVVALVVGIGAGGMIFDRVDAPAPRYAEASH